MLESAGIRQLNRAMTMIGILGHTSRSKELTRARKYYWGTQYDDLREWTDESVGIRGRKPTVRVRLCKICVDRVNAYLFGALRAPQFSIDGNPEATAVLHDLHAESGLEAALMEVGRLGLLQGEVAIAFHALEGAIDVEFLATDHATVRLGRDDKALAQQLGIDFDDVLELDEYWRSFEEDAFGSLTEEWLHRRTWLTDRTIEYEPLRTRDLKVVEGSTTLADLPWVEDDERTVIHELGFCPLEWIPNNMIAGSKEGHPLLGGSEFDIEDDINYTLSQTGRGIQYNGEPLTVFLNVQGADSGSELKRGAGNTLSVSPRPGATQSADAKILEISGSGQALAMEYARRLQDLVFNVASVVDHDPQLYAGTLSGVALERVLAPMVMKVQSLRPTYGARLARFLEKMAVATARLPPDVSVSVEWPDVVEKTDEDRMSAVMTVGDAFDRGFLTRRTAVERIAAIFGVEDPAAYVEELLVSEIGEGTGTVETTE